MAAISKKMDKLYFKVDTSKIERFEELLAEIPSILQKEEIYSNKETMSITIHQELVDWLMCKMQSMTRRVAVEKEGLYLYGIRTFGSKNIKKNQIVIGYNLKINTLSKNKIWQVEK